MLGSPFTDKKVVCDGNFVGIVSKVEYPQYYAQVRLRVFLLTVPDGPSVAVVFDEILFVFTWPAPYDVS